MPEVRGAAALAVGEMLGCVYPPVKLLGNLNLAASPDLDDEERVHLNLVDLSDDARRADLLLATKLLPLYNDCRHVMSNTPPNINTPTTVTN